MTAARRFIRRPIKALVIVFLPLAWAGALAAAPVDLAQLVEAIRAEIEPRQAMDFMQQVYSTDRWFTYPKFQETAEFLKKTMAVNPRYNSFHVHR